MYESLIDIAMNLIFLVVYATLGFVLFYRFLVSREMNYELVKVCSGYVFSFRLGIFAGKLRLKRQKNCPAPYFVKRLEGWDIIFPSFYTDGQINEFIMRNDPPGSRKASHSRDLDVYREVVIKRNEKLYCSAGKICNWP